MEPDWNAIAERMMLLTVKQLKPVRWWFYGCLGGASTKSDVVRQMVSQMRHWWRLSDGRGKQRVRNVLKDLKEAEEGA